MGRPSLEHRRLSLRSLPQTATQGAEHALEDALAGRAELAAERDSLRGKIASAEKRAGAAQQAFEEAAKERDFLKQLADTGAEVESEITEEAGGSQPRVL